MGISERQSDSMYIRFRGINLTLNLMPKLFLLTVLLWMLPVIASADADLARNHISSDVPDTSFSDALAMYRQHDYQGALNRFSEIDGPLAKLFAAKSAYGLGYYSQAVTLAQAASLRSPSAIAYEADFVKAMAHYQLKNFHDSLIGFYALCQRAESNELAQQSCSQFDEIISFLSFDQRLQILERVQSSEIREALFSESILQRFTPDQINRIQQSAAYTEPSATEYSGLVSADTTRPVEFGIIPKGTVFTIGILLPGFNEDTENQPVSRGIYTGILLAADQFNRQHSDYKARIVFKDSDSNPENPGSLVSDLINESKVDLLVGPLYSEQVQQLAPLVNRQRIPLFAPLANTINLSDSSSYVFQINPSFEARGRQIAQYLVTQLGKKRIGIITEQGSFGETEARAFKLEAEALGAEIPLFFSEDFAANGYSVSHILPWFSNNDELIEDTLSYRADSLDAVFLSFTSDLGEILLDLTLTGLEAFQPDYTILTNETLSYIDHSIQRTRSLDMIYADTYYLQESSENVINFNYDYRNRTGYNPTMFSYIGYDIGTFLLSAIEKLKNPANFSENIQYIDVFDGIATRINFGQSTMNQSLQFFRMTTTGVENVTEMVIEIPADSLDVQPEFQIDDF